MKLRVGSILSAPVCSTPPSQLHPRAARRVGRPSPVRVVETIPPPAAREELERIAALVNGD